MVSIIVPVYNCEKYLDACVASLLGQSCRDLELILVDDGSSDRSGALCDGYARGDSRVRVLHLENGGASRARNAGLDAATGDWVGFCDSDDAADSEMLTRMLDGIAQTGADSALCGYRLCDSALVPTLPDQEDTAELLTPQQAMAGVFFDRHYGTHQGYIWNRLFRRSILEKYSIRFDETVVFSEDKIFICDYLDRSEGVFYTAKPYYNYRANPGGITKSGQYIDGGRDEIYVYHHLSETLRNADDETRRIMTGWHLHNCIVRLFTLYASRSGDRALGKLFFDEMKGEKNLSRYPEFLKRKQRIFAALCRLLLR